MLQMMSLRQFSEPDAMVAHIHQQHLELCFCPTLQLTFSSDFGLYQLPRGESDSSAAKLCPSAGLSLCLSAVCCWAGSLRGNFYDFLPKTTLWEQREWPKAAQLKSDSKTMSWNSLYYSVNPSSIGIILCRFHSDFLNINNIYYINC